MSSDSFDPENHIYTRHFGRVPGATDIIKAEGLVATEWMTEEARWRGQCVHRGVELLVAGELDWGTVDPAHVGFILSAKKFLAVSEFEVVGAERPMFDTAFACIPDLWGRLNGSNAIVELKTGHIPSWAAIQTALQKRALKHNGFVARKRFGLRLMEDGSMAKLRAFDDERDEQVAMSMLDAFHWKKDHGYIPDWNKKGDGNGN